MGTDCPNWMTLQESGAGVLRSPLFSSLQTHLPRRGLGVNCLLLTPGNQYFIYCSEGELPGDQSRTRVREAGELFLEGSLSTGRGGRRQRPREGGQLLKMTQGLTHVLD